MITASKGTVIKVRIKVVYLVDARVHAVPNVCVARRIGDVCLRITHVPSDNSRGFVYCMHVNFLWL